MMLHQDELEAKHSLSLKKTEILLYPLLPILIHDHNAPDSQAEPIILFTKFVTFVNLHVDF